MNDYLTAINEQSSTTVPVKAIVTATYNSQTNAGSIQVNNASEFFPTGSTTPVTTTVIPPPNRYSRHRTLGELTSFVANSLFVGSTTPEPTDRANMGSTLSATVTPSSLASTASIIPSYIINRTNQMAIDLVKYFNSLPLRLPFFNTPPHTPNNRGAIQNYVYDSVASGGTGSTIAAGHPLADLDRFPRGHLRRNGQFGYHAIGDPDLERGE